ncbi:MAG: ABC transporter substrate-binding protein, partial [Rhodospirillales bacterium]
MYFRKSMFAAAAGLCLTFAAGTAAQAQTITIGLGTEPTSIDPHYHNLGPNNQIAQHIFSRLMEQDHKQRLMPGLATEWKPVDDTTWEFKLRKGVKFHDGSEFNVDDVI